MNKILYSSNQDVKQSHDFSKFIVSRQQYGEI